jgi:cellulose synthase/poly-beta-1,6-N-acetylglucosamine synthase-like glycosyltransferase
MVGRLRTDDVGAGGVTDVLQIVVLVVFVYFALYNLATLVLLALSYGEMSWLVRGRQPGRSGLRPLAHRPGLSVLVPAYNEQELIVTTATSLLAQEYSPLEVVIVDDGSTDATFERLSQAFELVPLPLGSALPLDHARIRGVYASRVSPALIVVQKDNGGRADALNAGLGFARHELVAITDADSILAPDALARALRPFEEHPDDCVAVGGNVRVVNSSRVEGGRMVDPNVSRHGLGATQVLEYLRGFLGVRIAWSRMNGLPIISGGFGLFRRDTLIGIGGFLTGSMGEDLEVTLRLHHELRPNWPSARVAFVPEAICWTQAPDTLRGLRTQRIRWHVGLLQTLGQHFGMFGRRRYGAVGLFAVPYAVLFEAISALFEVAGYAIVITLFVLDQSTWPYLVAWFSISLLFGQAQSAVALLIEEVGFRLYGRLEMTRLLGWGLLEIFWYRPLLALWRTWATVVTLVGRTPGWGRIPRRALDETPAESVVPLTR